MRLLSGRRHRVLTGVALACRGRRLASGWSKRSIAMKRLSEQEIDFYADHGEWRGKAGGYALQGYGEVYVRHIAGSYSNVVGLPLAETRVLLRGRDIRLPEWLVERGIGENRSALVEDGEIVEARVELEGRAAPARSLRRDWRASAGRNASFERSAARNICCRAARRGVTEGAAIDDRSHARGDPGSRAVEAAACPRITSDGAGTALADGSGDGAPVPLSPRPLEAAGWSDLLDEARAARRVRRRRAADLGDAGDDSDRRRRHLPPASSRSPARGEAARAIRRLGIGGSIGIDLPTVGQSRAPGGGGGNRRAAAATVRTDRGQRLRLRPDRAAAPPRIADRTGAGPGRLSKPARCFAAPRSSRRAPRGWSRIPAVIACDRARIPIGSSTRARGGRRDRLAGRSELRHVGWLCRQAAKSKDCPVCGKPPTQDTRRSAAAAARIATS